MCLKGSMRNTKIHGDLLECLLLVAAQGLSPDRIVRSNILAPTVCNNVDHNVTRRDATVEWKKKTNRRTRQTKEANNNRTDCSFQTLKIFDVYFARILTVICKWNWSMGWGGGYSVSSHVQACLWTTGSLKESRRGRENSNLLNERFCV